MRPRLHDPIFALKRSEDGWVVFELEKRRILFEASFVEAWTYAAELAARAAPASVVALNDDWNVVAQTIILEGAIPLRPLIR